MSNQDVFLEGALLEEGRITRSQLEAARRYCIEQEVDLVDALILTEAVSSHDIARARASIAKPRLLIWLSTRRALRTPALSLGQWRSGTTCFRCSSSTTFSHWRWTIR